MPEAADLGENFRDDSLETISFPTEESKEYSGLAGSFNFGRSFENITKTYKLINEK
jgi:hypothetical protein